MSSLLPLLLCVRLSVYAVIHLFIHSMAVRVRVPSRVEFNLFPGRAIVKKLRIEDIQVDSYNTHAIPAVHGTVQANMATVLRCPTNPVACPAPTDAASCQSGTFCC
jgi:hypothetical protein